MRIGGGRCKLPAGPNRTKARLLPKQIGSYRADVQGEEVIVPIANRSTIGSPN